MQRSDQRKMIAHIEAEPLAKIDYVEIVDAQSLEPVSEIRGRDLRLQWQSISVRPD